MSDANAEIIAARERLKQRFSENTRTGGKGSMRRKKKTTHKTTSTDDKRLQATLKRLGVTSIPAIEEVNIFQNDGNVIHFENPKVQAAVAANTFVVSGSAQTKPMQELLPGILSQLGAEAIPNLKQLMETLSARAGMGAGADDDVADVEGTFDEAEGTAADVGNVD